MLYCTLTNTPSGVPGELPLGPTRVPVAAMEPFGSVALPV